MKPERFAYGLALLAVVLAAALGWQSCRVARQAADAPAAVVREAGEALAGIAERFRTGRITTTFRSELPTLLPGEALLEVAAIEAPETVRREDARAAFFDLLPLGTTVSEIRTLVTYRYHLALSDEWTLEERDGVCFVRAPRLRPSLPPAIHTDRMEKHAQSGWARFDAAAQLAALEKDLTPLLSARAMAPERVALVREPARRKVAAFVRSFLLREDHWRAGRFTAIVVTFADEPPASSPRPPTLKLEPLQ